MTLSTHVLDVAAGRPADGIAIALYALDGERTELAQATTNADGRTDAPLAVALAPGTYELVFTVAPYFARSGTSALYDRIPIRFVVTGAMSRCHIPLLLAPWGYSTYRGS